EAGCCRQTNTRQPAVVIARSFCGKSASRGESCAVIKVSAVRKLGVSKSSLGAGFTETMANASERKLRNCSEDPRKKSIFWLSRRAARTTVAASASQPILQD